MVAAGVPPSTRLVDPDAVLARVVGFARALDAAGLATDPASAIDFVRALGIIDIGSRAEVHAAGSAVFVRRRDDLPVYDAIFAAFWRAAAHEVPPPPDDATTPRPPEALEGDEGAVESRPEAQGDRSAAVPQRAEPAADEEASEGEMRVVTPRSYSESETLRHREFDRMTPAELRDAERLIGALRPRLETRRTRRHELHPHGRLLAPRVMFRRNLATGGDLVDWVWRRPRRRPRSIVVICDVSGSMERHSRLLLRFVHALFRSPGVRAEAFVFGTHLTRVTRELRSRDPDRALARVSDAVSDWSGGTRIGDSFRTFNLRWARRALRSSAVVVVVSDGWDRGDPALVRRETARLQRSCHRLVWMDPLAGSADYRPVAAGMAAAYESIDDVLPMQDVTSLERLGEVLAGLTDAGAGRPERRGRPRIHGAAPRTRTGGGPGHGWRDAPARPLAGTLGRPDEARAIT
jgi:uncharacterized protein